MKEIPALYDDKEMCCACGACLNVCPRSAISMNEDDNGFLFPKINSELCIQCGRCVSCCFFKTSKSDNTPLETYAAVAKDEKMLKSSASGGAFAALASCFIEQGGIVFGAKLEDDYTVNHVMISSIDELIQLQNSKYTQSSIGTSYTDAEKALKCGKAVLFSGTPCQIDGLFGAII